MHWIEVLTHRANQLAYRRPYLMSGILIKASAQKTQSWGRFPKHVRASAIRSWGCAKS